MCKSPVAAPPVGLRAAHEILSSFFILRLVVMAMTMSEYMHQWTSEEYEVRQRVNDVACVIPQQIDAENCECERNRQPQFGTEETA
jgi:hypothetical protein